jgi:hypothetical protein
MNGKAALQNCRDVNSSPALLQPKIVVIFLCKWATIGIVELATIAGSQHANIAQLLAPA